MASGRMAPSNAKSGRNVDPTLRPDSRLAFRRQVRQTHGTHGTQGIIFADDPGAPESPLNDQTHHLQPQTHLQALWQTQAQPGCRLTSSPNHLCLAGKDKT